MSKPDPHDLIELAHDLLTQVHMAVHNYRLVFQPDPHRDLPAIEQHAEFVRLMSKIQTHVDDCEDWMQSGDQLDLERGRSTVVLSPAKLHDQWVCLHCRQPIEKSGSWWVHSHSQAKACDR